MTSGRVAVVGTLNLDLVVRVARRPDVGETVLGRSLTERPGGKGANQAAAAARGAETWLVGAVGDDPAGDTMLAAQRQAGVRTERVLRVDDVSGTAIIEVDDSGDNRIIVISGANAHLDPAAVRTALDDISPAVVLTQLESPREVTEATATWCLDHGRRFILNPSPVAELPSHILASADPIVVNETEAHYYGDGAETLAGVVESLRRRSRSVVVTLGGEPTLVADPTGRSSVPVSPVSGVETTGAGDHFAGVLAARLAVGASLHDAAIVASTAATEYITARSAR